MRITFIIWISLVSLTVISSVVSIQSFSYATGFIMLLAGIKFLTIAFQFMELKKAHLFWKILLASFLMLFIGIVFFLKMM